MVKDWISRRCFNAVHQQNLVYNTCWEDPRLDRRALNLGSDDSLLVITSAGCNALDYALQSPKEIFAIDMNVLQNSLLELKKAAIKTLDFSDFFQVFGKGQHSDWVSIYNDAIRPSLSKLDQQIWDARHNFFDGTAKRKSFYFRGTSGLFAWIINGYINRPKGLREAVHEILSAKNVEEQTEIFESRRVAELLFSKPIRWALKRDMTMAMLGVPRSQRRQIDREHPGGIGQFIQDRIEKVFKSIPLMDNYFWRVYLTGCYTKTCCPEYLTQAGFDRLKSGLVDRISTHTTTVENFLSNHSGQISRYVLLDHMDWLYEHYPQQLAAEWQCIFNRSAPQTRILWRSAALSCDFVDPLIINNLGRQQTVGDLLNYHSDLAGELHTTDRVHTYGSFYIADLDGLAA